MERHFAAVSFTDSSTDDNKRRSLSFSELPTSQRILIEECYQGNDSSTLVRQYSCEQIFNRNSNTRQINVLETVRKVKDYSTTDTWKTTKPVFGSFGNLGWQTRHFNQSRKAIEPPISHVINSIDTKENQQKQNIENFEKAMPILQLNGMKISDTNDAIPQVKSPENLIKNKSNPLKIGSKPKKDPLSDTSAIETKEKKPRYKKKTKMTDYNEIKKNIRSLVATEDTTAKISQSSSSYSKKILFLLLPLFVLILATFIHFEYYSNYETDFNFVNMTQELHEKISGQNHAVNNLIYELKKSSDGVNLIAIVGGTGVGKSYSVGIVTKHFFYKNHIFEYVSPLQKIVHEVFETFSLRHCNLLILENLKMKDLTDVINFVTLAKNQSKPFCIYVLGIFNPQEVDEDLGRHLDLKKSIQEIKTALRQVDLDDEKIIGFQPLDNRSLDLCIRQAARDKNIILSESELLLIRSSLISSNSGCKGAYAKV